MNNVIEPIEIPGEEKLSALKITALIIVFCIILFVTVVQLLIYDRFIDKGPISLKVVETFITINAVMVFFMAALALLNVLVRKFCSKYFETFLKISLHIGTVVIMFFWLVHIHFAGSQHSLLIMLIVITAIFDEWLLGLRASWFYLIAGTAALALLITLEYRGVLPYSPLFTNCEQMRRQFLQPYYIFANMGFYVVIAITVQLVLFLFEREREKSRKKLEKAYREVQTANREVRHLRGLLPMCAHCKKIRDDEGYWEDVSKYIHDRTDAQISHSICPACMKELYPGLSREILEEDEDY